MQWMMLHMGKVVMAMQYEQDCCESWVVFQM